MKVIKKKGAKTRNVTLRINEDVMKEVDKYSKNNGISRQKLIEAVLEKAFSDKNFVLEIS